MQRGFMQWGFMHRRLIPLVVLTLAALAVAPLAGAQTGPPRSKPQYVHTHALAQTLLEGHLRRTGAVGGSVAVMRDGKLLWSGEAGFANRERGHRVTPDTRFRLGSIAKAVTGILVAQQVREGRLDLDADVRKWVPEWPAGTEVVTLRHLLSHTAGIRHYVPLRTDNSTRQYDRAVDALALFAQDPRVGRVGEKYAYSTHAFTLVAAALEAVDGPFGTQVRRRIGLPTLRVENAGPEPRWRSQVYVLASGGPARVSTPRENLSWKAAGGGMEATAIDLARFGDRVRAGRLGTPADRNLVWTAQSTSDGRRLGYGLGWSVETRPGLPTRYGHAGAQQGCSSRLLVDPKTGLTVAVLLNTGITDASALAERLMRLFTEGNLSPASRRPTPTAPARR